MKQKKETANMPGHISPEERLLNLIRQDQRPSEPKPQKPATDSAGSSPEERSAKSPALKKTGRGSSLSPGFKFKKIRVHFSFNSINRLLFWLFVIMGIYLLSDSLINGPAEIKKRISALKQVKAEQPQLVLQRGTPTQPLSYYSETVTSRKLFAGRSVQARTKPPTATFMDKVSQFKLQGVILGEAPQAIIENTRTRKVHFLAPGERIGEIELKQVLPGKAVLSYQGEEMELSL